MTNCQPSRVHRFFSGIFHHRSRSQSPQPKEHKQVNGNTGHKTGQAASQDDKNPLNSATPSLQVPSSQDPASSPVDNHEGAESEPSGTQDGTHAPGSKPDTALLPDHENKMVHSPDTKVSGTAYDEAWSRLSDDERANLSNETSIRTLFEKLDETDQQHQSNSWLKRGKMAAGLQYVSNICGWIDLVAAWIPEPSLGAVLGLIKGIVAVSHFHGDRLVGICSLTKYKCAVQMAVGICGAYDSLTGHIREFLDRVPVIERCNTVLWSNRASFDIHNVRQPLPCFVAVIMRYES